MAASLLSRPRRPGARFSPAIPMLATSLFIGTISSTSTQAEPVTLNGAAYESGVALAADELAGLSLPVLGASPVSAATIHSSAAILISPPGATIPNQSGTRPLGAASEKPNDEKEVDAPVVPEPASLILGLTSTLVLGSLSWKRRLTRHHQAS